MKKPWGGRFREKTSGTVEAFTESISFDRRLWKHDIEGSIAHADMLGRQGIIPLKDAKKISSGLRGIAADIRAGRFRFRPELEDIHMNIEAALTDRIGEAGKRLHTARSRNDQVALDLRLYVKEETARLMQLLTQLQRVLLWQAERNMEAVMPGYTHMQRAQPVLLSHHLMAYIEMFERDKGRLGDSVKRCDVLPLGSCALAGTTLPIDRAAVARALGFRHVSRNSIDAVSDRDFVLEFLAAAAIAMVHLSRLAEEFVLWSTEEFAFIELADRFTTGSSIMPQKKNPDVAELTRGKTGRVVGNLVALLTVMKGLPLAYNRDMQEDKLPLFDTVDTLTASLAVIAEMLHGTKFRRGKMASTAGAGFSTATDLAEYLVRKGMPFRQAHEVTGKIVLRCIEGGKTLSSLTAKELRSFSSLIRADIHSVLAPEESVKARASYGGTAPAQVRRQIAALKKSLA